MNGNQFIWLISYDGPETFAERNALYWASPQRAAMGLDPDDYLVRTEDRTVEGRRSYELRPGTKSPPL
ncbi:hypothetical protein ACIHCQ_30170 [Streptomyces sp. NPDC052236]|uniref:hypothetical protein n=1 Tax=Streptomyces sp. NPDC052236 TaxID=3365686 RepID=UPI0037D53105